MSDGGLTLFSVAKASLDSSRQLRSPYTLDDVYLALRLLAWFGGNLNRTARALRAHGRPISKRTLESWSQYQHVDLYAEVSAEAHREASQRSLVRAGVFLMELAGLEPATS